MGLNLNEIVVILLIITIASLGFIFPKSKRIFWFEFIILTLLIALYNSLDSDLLFYSYEYEHDTISASIFEKGYEYLGILFRNLGFSFEEFHIIIALVSMLAFAYVIRKESPQPAFCMSLMYGFATLEYIYQLKSLTASAIIILAIHDYFKDIHNKRNVIKFIFMILFASAFHFFSILFLPMVLTSIKSRRKFKKIVLLIFLFSIIFFGILIQLARNLIPAFETYLDPLSFRTVSLSIAWHLFGILLMIEISKATRYGKVKLLCGRKIDETLLIENIYRCSYCLLLAIPLYYYTNVTMRVVRTWSIFYFVAISYLQTKKFILNRASMLKIGMIVYIIFSFFAYHVWFTRYTTLVKDFIDYNLLLKTLFALD